MDDEKRIEALLDLYKQQMQHFQHTQEIEWKANFGVWTLLAASIYVVTKESVHIHRGCWMFIALITAVVVHTCWLLRVHCSEVADKQLWSRYRIEALALIRANAVVHDHEAPFTRSAAREMSWLSVEVMITVLLSVFLYLSLPA